MGVKILIVKSQSHPQNFLKTLLASIGIVQFVKVFLWKVACRSYFCALSWEVVKYLMLTCAVKVFVWKFVEEKSSLGWDSDVLRFVILESGPKGSWPKSFHRSWWWKIRTCMCSNTSRTKLEMLSLVIETLKTMEQTSAFVPKQKSSQTSVKSLTGSKISAVQMGALKRV